MQTSMKLNLSSIFFWSVGPICGILLLATALLMGFGPGFLVLSVWGFFGVLVVTPVVEGLLRRRDYFRMRSIQTALIAVGVVLAGLVAAVLSGKFFYW